MSASKSSSHHIKVDGARCPKTYYWLCSCGARGGSGFLTDVIASGRRHVRQAKRGSRGFQFPKF